MRKRLRSLGFYRNVVVLGLSSSIMSFGSLMWVFFIPIILGHLLLPFYIGAIYSLGYGLGAIMPIFAGTMIDRYGRKNVIILAGLLSMVGVALMGILASSLLLVIPFLVDMGIGTPLSKVAGQAMIMDSTPEKERGAGFGAFFQLAGLPGTVAPLVGGILLSGNMTSAMFYVSAALMGVGLAIRALFLQDKTGPMRPETRFSGALSENSSRLSKLVRDSWDSMKQLLSNRMLLALALSYSIYNFFVSPGSTFVVPLYAKQVLQLSDAQIGIMFGVMNFFVTQLSIPFGKLADKIGRQQTIVISWLGEMGFMMIWIYSFSSGFPLVTFSLWVLFASMDTPAEYALLGTITEGEPRGRSLGFFNSLTAAVLVPSAFLAGVLYSASPMFPFFANLALGIFCLYFFVSILMRTKL